MPSKRRDTPDVLQTMKGAIIKIRADYSSQLSSRGLRNAPPGAREFIRAAQSALSEVESAIDAAAFGVPATLNNRRLYPQEREQQAKEALGELERLVAEQTTIAQNALGFAKDQLTKQALRPVDRREELTARADAQMILDRTPADQRDGVMARLAQRQDAVGALVSSDWGRDYLSTVTPDTTLADAMHLGVRTAAVDAAAAQSLDEGRRDAALHIGVLPVLHGLRDSVMHTGRMVTESLRDDHGLHVNASIDDAFAGSDSSGPVATLEP
ncbi:MAG: hypothetical protein ACRDQU_14800 [Pseudonocardiaceae bacterium]